MVWEVVFMLVLLKIPIVYLCMVVWWAIRAEPVDGPPPAVGARVSDTPLSPTGRPRTPRGGRRLDDGRRGPRTRPATRPHAARSEVRP